MNQPDGFSKNKCHLDGFEGEKTHLDGFFLNATWTAFKKKKPITSCICFKRKSHLEAFQKRNKRKIKHLVLKNKYSFCFRTV